MSAQILICIDDHLQIGDCTYSCEGMFPQLSSSSGILCCFKTLWRLVIWLHGQ